MRDRYSDKGLNLVLDLDEKTGLETLVDPVRFAQVMTNLLSNALRHTPAGGTITLAAGREGGEAIITVTDTGTWDPSPSERFRGRGLALITALSDTHALTTGPDGTTVTMCWQPMRDCRDVIT